MAIDNIKTLKFLQSLTSMNQGEGHACCSVKRKKNFDYVLVNHFSALFLGLNDVLSANQHAEFFARIFLV